MTVLAAQINRRRLLVLLVVAAWAAIALVQLIKVARASVDLHQSMATMSSGELAVYWNGPAEPFAKFVATQVPENATVTLLGMSSQDANVMDRVLYPRVVVVEPVGASAGRSANDYIAYFEPQDEFSSPAAAPSDFIRIWLQRLALRSESSQFVGPDGTVGVLVKVGG